MLCTEYLGRIIYLFRMVNEGILYFRERYSKKITSWFINRIAFHLAPRFPIKSQALPKFLRSHLLNMHPAPIPTQRNLLITLHPSHAFRILAPSPRTNIHARKLPRRDAPLKQDIQLTIRPAPRLRKTEVRPQPAEEAHARPEEARLALPVPRRGVQHVRHDDAVDDAHDVVDVAGQHDGFGFQARGGDLGHERVADGPDGDVVGEGVDEEQGADSPGCAFGV